MVIEINGKKYKHISSFEKNRNTIKQYILRAQKKDKSIDAVILPEGYYIAESEWPKFNKKSVDKTNEKN